MLNMNKITIKESVKDSTIIGGNVKNTISNTASTDKSRSVSEKITEEVTDVLFSSKSTVFNRILLIIIFSLIIVLYILFNK